MNSRNRRLEVVLNHLSPLATQDSNTYACPVASSQPPPDNKVTFRHGGDLVGEVLRCHGVEFVFTLSGGHISPVLVGAKKSGIRVIDVRHEVNAVFAADAVSRLSPSIGVACVTAGPGLTNTITAVKNAFMAQSPLLLLGGATAQLLKGRGSLQDIDQQALFQSHVKWQSTVRRVADIVPVLNEAIQRAQSGVPGPVFIELPLDVLYPSEVIKGQFLSQMNGTGISDRLTKWYLTRKLNGVYGDGSPLEVSCPKNTPATSISDWELDKVESYLRRAKKPVMVLGSQIVSSYEDVHHVTAAVGVLGLPVYLSGMARGLMGRNHPLHMRHKRGNALKEADLVLFFGVTCDFRLGYGKSIPSSTPFLSVNQDKEQLYKNRTPTVPIHTDSPPKFLVFLANRFRNNVKKPDLSSWVGHLRQRDDARDSEIIKMSQQPVQAIENGKPRSCVNPMKLLLEADQVFDEDTILVADGGDFVATASYIVHPNRLSWLDPGPFGTLGVGAGFAIGAKLCRPEANVWLIWGDGSSAYSLMEYDTMVRHNIPVLGLIGNDGCWSQIERDQTPTFGDNVACMLTYNDYHKIADALGGVGFLLDKEEDIRTTLEQAKAIISSKSTTHQQPLPVVVNAIIGKTNFRQGSISI